MDQHIHFKAYLNPSDNAGDNCLTFIKIKPRFKDFTRRHDHISDDKQCT